MGSGTIRIGNVEITALIDARAKAGCDMIFPSVGADAWKPYCDQLLDDCRNVPITIPSFLVRSGGKTLLIDTGIGGKQRPMFPVGRLPDALAEVGVRPDEIDVVMATHIHIDHVGWHTTARDGAFPPTFPNARYVFNRAEWEFFTRDDQVALPDREYVRDCVLPLDGAADVQLVDGEHRLTDELTLLPTPGHTPAHVSIAIMSGGESAVLIGDICHHPAQMTETGWTPIFDMNPALAAETREKLMRRIEEERLTVIAGHFAHPGFGRLVRVEGRRTWQAL